MANYFISPSDIIVDDNEKGMMLLFSKRTTFKATWNNKSVTLRPLFKTIKGLDVNKVQEIFISETESIANEVGNDRLVKTYGFVVERFLAVEERLELGTSLHEYLQENRSISWKGRYVIAYDVAQAMSYLHSSKTVFGFKPERLHKNLCSATILLVKEGRKLRAKVAEANLMTMREAVLDMHQIPKKKKSNYMDMPTLYNAPELTSSDIAMHSRETDVYSFGLVLMELAMMRLTSDKMVMEYRNLKPDQVELLMPAIIKSIIDSCIDVNASNRPAFKLVAMYLKTNKEDIIRYKTMEELEQELEDEWDIPEEQTPCLDPVAQEELEMRTMAISEGTAMPSAPTARHHRPSNAKAHLLKQRGAAYYRMRNILVALFTCTLIVLCVLAYLISYLSRVSVRSAAATVPSVVPSLQIKRIPTYLPPTESAYPFPTATPAPTRVLKNFGNMSLPNWAGVNSFFLHALQESDMSEVVLALKDANMKAVRIFISGVGSNSKGSNSFGVNDVEVGGVGQFDDDILQRIDLLMDKMYKAGMKLVVTLHDRYSLGCWATDVYVQKYKLPATSNCNTNVNIPREFYDNPAAGEDFDRRAEYILAHKNPYFNNRTWSELSEVILSFGIENESQGHMPRRNEDWLCDRARYLRPRVVPDIHISTGGGAAFADSMAIANFRCPFIDVVALHSYEQSVSVFRTQLTAAQALATTYNKLIVMEEYGANTQANKPALFKSIAELCNSMNIPWMPWQVMKPNNPNDFEFYTDDTDTWNVLTEWAGKALLPKSTL